MKNPLENFECFKIAIKSKKQTYTIFEVELNGEPVGQFSVSPNGFSLQAFGTKKGWRGKK